MFNLHTLEIFTAGGGKSDLAIPGLEGDTAQQIKEFLVKKTAIAEEETVQEEQDKAEDLASITSDEETAVPKTYTDSNEY